MSLYNVYYVMMIIDNEKIIGKCCAKCWTELTRAWLPSENLMQEDSADLAWYDPFFRIAMARGFGYNDY